MSAPILGWNFFLSVRERGKCRQHKYETPENHPHIVALKKLIENPDEKCINWPFAISDQGYGIFKKRRAHVIALILHTGELPPINMVSAHECGNRRCVNPLHLSWKTQAENLLDKKRHGTWGKKLSESDIAAIRADKRTGEEIARDYGVHQTTISKIMIGKRWQQ